MQADENNHRSRWPVSLQWPSDSPQHEYAWTMSSSDPTDSAAKAIADAIHRSAVESWTLYSIGVASTVLRTYARMRGSGFRGLRTEDYLVWIGIVRPPVDPTSIPRLANLNHCRCSIPFNQVWHIAWGVLPKALQIMV